MKMFGMPRELETDPTIARTVHKSFSAQKEDRDVQEGTVATRLEASVA